MSLNVDLLRQAGLDEQTIDRLVREAEKREFEEKIKSLFSAKEVKNLKTYLQNLSFDVTVILTKENGQVTVTVKNNKARQVSRSGKKVKLADGRLFPTFKAACDALGLRVGKASAHYVLDKNHVQYELVEA